MKKPSLPFLGFLQASGLATYLILLSYFLNFIQTRLFDGADTQLFYAPIIMLLIFILSAVISASLVLGKAGILFWEKNYKDSFALIGHTALWILTYIVIFMLLLNFG